VDRSDTRGRGGYLVSREDMGKGPGSGEERTGPLEGFDFEVCGFF